MPISSWCYREPAGAELDTCGGLHRCSSVSRSSKPSPEVSVASRRSRRSAACQCPSASRSPSTPPNSCERDGCTRRSAARIDDDERRWDRLDDRGRLIARGLARPQVIHHRLEDDEEVPLAVHLRADRVTSRFTVRISRPSSSVMPSWRTAMSSALARSSALAQLRRDAFARHPDHVALRSTGRRLEVRAGAAAELHDLEPSSTTTAAGAYRAEQRVIDLAVELGRMARRGPGGNEASSRPMSAGASTTSPRSSRSRCAASRRTSRSPGSWTIVEPLPRGSGAAVGAVVPVPDSTMPIAPSPATWASDANSRSIGWSERPPSSGRSSIAPRGSSRRPARHDHDRLGSSRCRGPGLAHRERRRAVASSAASFAGLRGRQVLENDKRQTRVERQAGNQRLQCIQSACRCADSDDALGSRVPAHRRHRASR